MDAELAISSVSIDSWETEGINEQTIGKKVIDIGTESGLKCWLCRLMQGL